MNYVERQANIGLGPTSSWRLTQRNLHVA